VAMLVEFTWGLLIMSRKDRVSSEALQRLEPDAGKLARPVPRRAAAGNSGSLSGNLKNKVTHEIHRRNNNKIF